MRGSRYELLGCKHHVPLDEVVDALVEDFRGPGNYPPNASLGYMLYDDVWNSVAFAVLHHLGYKTPGSIEGRVNLGFDTALDYFFGSWRFGRDPNDNDPNENWFQTFSHGLFLGLLTERWNDVAKLCSFARADLPAEYLGGEIEWEGTLVYLSIAAGLREEPFGGLTEVEATIKKCRKKRPRLLLQAWEAARMRDQIAFDKAIRDSLLHFDATYFVKKARSINEWIAQHQSVIVLAALRLGLRFPDLPERLAAMIVTRESLGLRPESKG